MVLLLSCNNVSYKTKHHTILSDISFELHMGDIVTVIGPNGGGKTTLAQILIGIINPSSGTVTKKKNLTIGYMPQRINLNSLVPITVKEFLFFYGSEQYSVDSIDQILEENGITKILDKQIYNLSGGELQRVLFARVLLRDPELLILDEPIQGLDVVGQRDFYSKIDKLRLHLKKSIIMISHDLHTVMSSSDKVVCLNHKIHCSGKPSDIKSHQSYKDLFRLEGEEVVSTYMHKHNNVKHDE